MLDPFGRQATLGDPITPVDLVKHGRSTGVP